MLRRLLAVVALVALAASPVSGQGRQSGALGGRVSSSDGQPLPGASVTVVSTALQGTRAVVADVNGVYRLAGLPAGDYVVTFEMSGMSSVERRARISLGGDVTIDQQLTLEPVREVIDVRGATPSAVASPTGAFNLRASDTTLLPSGRTPFLLAELAPGLTDNTPNNNQVTIGGGFAYDNVFLMNGVDINDNVLGQPNALFIEEAIEEVQVLTSAISAEYGRFGGGVVNVITRSGGNAFSGAFRLNLTNPAWAVETPFEKSRGTTRASKLSPTYEATSGGPLVRDKLWYFGGARVERTTTQSAFAQTGSAVHEPQREHSIRGEADRDAAQRSHHPGIVHQQRHRLGAAGAARGHRSEHFHDALDAQPAAGCLVARRARVADVCDGSVLAEVVEVAERRRFVDSRCRLAVHDSRHARCSGRPSV